MAPLPQSNTMRWWAVYTANSTQHRLMIRTAPGVTAAQMNTIFTSLFNNLTSALNTINVQNLEFADLGSNVRNTAAWTGPASFGSGTEVDTDGRARSFSFVGRSQDGRKARVFVFGVKPFSEGDYRVDTSEAVAVANTVTFLNGASGVFLSISGAQPTWKGYANIGFNDHWIKQYRKAGG
jgi:hypothetical protein